MKNKKGAGGTTILVVFLIAAVVGLAFWGVTQSTQTTRDIVDAGGCEIAPTLGWTVVNEYAPGTAVTGLGVNALVNDGAIPKTGVTTSTNFVKGDRVKVSLNASNFINKVVEDEIVMDCGSNEFEETMFATSTNTFRLYNSDKNLMEDTADTAASGVNQTQSATSIKVGVEIDGTNDESTGNLVIVVESTNTTEVDEITLSGLGGVESVSVPDFYTVNSAGSVVKAFRIPEVLDGATATGTLSATAESGETIGAMTAGNVFYVTAYSEQAFIDTDGKFKTGVEDADGNIKYEDTWDFDFIAS